MDQQEQTPEPRPLFTPEFEAKRRRSGIWSMILCVVLGVALLLGALYAREHGGMMTSGAQDHYTKYPWWLIAPVGAGVTLLGLWGLFRELTGRG